MVTTVSIQLIYVSTEKKNQVMKKQNDQKAGLSVLAEIALGIKMKYLSKPDGDFNGNSIALKFPMIANIAMPAKIE